MTVRLFVGNLAYNVTEADLKDLFSTVGQLTYVYLPTDRETGKMRGFAFVDFAERAQAEEAVRKFNNQLFKGRPLSINEAREREERPRSGPPSVSPPPRREMSGSPADFGGERAGAAKNFGPDAPPRRVRSKSKGSAKSERVPKGPLREVTKGQFFGGDEDDYDDDDMDVENFASRVDEPGDEENS